MYTVKYQKYFNDYKNSQEEKKFYSLQEVADWLFGMAAGEKYEKVMFFIDPDRERKMEGRWLDSSCIHVCNHSDRYIYYVEQIEKNGVIIYSCGTFTNMECHWNEEIKSWLRECRERMLHPTFNFG
jgi:hypothetical protein